MDNCTCISRERVYIVYGNDFTIEAHVSVYDKDEGIYKLLDLTGVKGCQMRLVGTYRKAIGKDITVTGSKVTAFFPGGSVGVGTYGVEITFVDSLGKGRIFERNLIGIVSASGEATVDNDIEGEAGEGLNVSVNVLTRTVRIGDVGSVLADYNLLENRPSIGGVTLEGNKMASDLGMYSKEEADEKFQTKESAAEADKRVQGMLDGKVDKESGKGLSTNDLTDERAGKVDKLKIDGRANEYLNGAGTYSRPVRQGYGVSVADDNTVSVDPQVIARQSDVANVAADLAAQKAKEQGDIDRANAAISKEETDRKAAVAALQSLIDTLNPGYQFMGVATPETNPGTPDQNVFYITSQSGTYTNFGGIIVHDNEIALLSYHGTWAKSSINAATLEQLVKLGLHQFLKVENATPPLEYDFPYFDGVSSFRFTNTGQDRIVLYLRKGHYVLTDQQIVDIRAGASITLIPNADYKVILYFKGTGGFVVNPVSNDQLTIENSISELVSRVDGLGDAINEIPGIKSRLTPLENAFIIEHETPVESSGRLDGYFITGSGELASENTSFIVYKYPVTPGEKLKIFNNWHLGSSYSYAFYTSNDFTAANCVGVGLNVTQAPDEQIAIAPNNAAYVGVQAHRSQQSVTRLYEQTVADAVGELEQKVDANTTAIERLSDLAKMAYKFDGQNLYIAYNDGSGVEITYWFKKCMANELFTFYRVGYRTVTRTVPDASNIDSDANIVLMNQTGSDNIGPVGMSTGGWTGGNHTYQGGDVKTAKTDSFRIVVDGNILQADDAGYCNNVYVFVENTLYDPAFAPEAGDTILSTKLCTENVTYAIRKNTIECAVSHKFVSTTTNTISVYYGMQSMFYDEDYIITPNGAYPSWQTPDNVSPFSKQDYPNFNRFIEKSTTKQAFQSTHLYTDYGLGKQRPFLASQSIYKRDSGKSYHRLILTMSDLANKYIEWSGGYSFFSVPILDDTNLFVYRGMYKGKDALFVNTKQAFVGSVEIPADLVIRKPQIVECFGITNAYDESDDFQVGGAGLYIKSVSTGSLILAFDAL